MVRQVALYRISQAVLMVSQRRESAEEEVQDISCLGSGGSPQLQKSSKIGGQRGLIETISAVLKKINLV